MCCEMLCESQEEANLVQLNQSLILNQMNKEQMVKCAELPQVKYMAYLLDELWRTLSVHAKDRDISRCDYFSSP